jgi:hypothetical protein
MYHGFCNKGGCHVDAKNSPAVTTIPKAQKTGHLKVVTRAHVTTSGSARADASPGVNYVTDGIDSFSRRRWCCSRPTRREHAHAAALEVRGLPNGLSNSHGQVGRHYFSHNQGAGSRRSFRRT